MTAKPSKVWKKGWWKFPILGKLRRAPQGGVMEEGLGYMKFTRAVLEFLLKVLGFFVILEPVWMLLPFAGFLYGSVLQIENLNQHPQTAWLTHFVFPILTGGWL
ncbi:MAG: hypothetical protein NTY53_11665, partial [Kiritimatiellaeota bacterium]|nr:hypothetical protein [Kiritimatiellota bacterium]